VRSIKLLALVAIIVCPRISEGHTFTGRVERVIDGDTIIVSASLPSCPSVQLHRIRLAEIDAPELKAPGGQESKQALEDMILRKTVTVEWKHRGKYRRIIGMVFLGEEYINHVLLTGAWAIRYAARK